LAEQEPVATSKVGVEGAKVEEARVEEKPEPVLTEAASGVSPPAGEKEVPQAEKSAAEPEKEMAPVTDPKAAPEPEPEPAEEKPQPELEAAKSESDPESELKIQAKATPESEPEPEPEPETEKKQETKALATNMAGETLIKEEVKTDDDEGGEVEPVKVVEN
jgi:hypothetical protein